MGIAITLESFLKEKNVKYEVISHDHTSYSTATAQSAHIPGDMLAKSIMLEDSDGIVMAMIPAARRLALDELNSMLNRQLTLTKESELQGLFQDCEPGAVPGLGDAYGMETVIDVCLESCKDIYFEGGSHKDVVHLSGKDFYDIQHNSKQGRFSRHI